MDYLKPYQSNHKYEIIQAPANLPVSLDEVKEQLRIDTSDTSQDTYLTLLIKAVTRFCEKYTKRTIINTGYRTLRNTLTPAIELMRSPFVSLENFKYTVDDALIDVDSSLYQLFELNEYATIAMKPDKQYPADGDDILQGIQIDFTAGYGESLGDNQADLKIAILNHIAELYENRGDCDLDNVMKCLPNTTRCIYNLYRILNIV